MLQRLFVLTRNLQRYNIASETDVLTAMQRVLLYCGQSLPDGHNRYIGAGRWLGSLGHVGVWDIRRAKAGPHVG